MAEINARVNEAYVSSVIEHLDEAYTKMDEARIWARRQAFMLAGAAGGAIIAADSKSELAFFLWVVVALLIVGAVALELGKYMQADHDAVERYNDAMDLVEFVENPAEKQDGINL